MKKIKLYFILLMLAVLPLNAFGGDESDAYKMAKEMNALQTAKDKAENAKKEIEKERNDLKKQLNDSLKTIKKLRGELEKLQGNLEKSQSDLKKSKEDLQKAKASIGNIEKPLRAQISQQKNEIDSLNNLLNDLAQLREKAARVDVWEKENADLVSQNKELQNNNGQLLTEIDNQKIRLNELAVFEAQRLVELSNSFQDKWATAPYSGMDAISLNQLKEDCEKYKDRDPKIKEASVKFANLQQELNAYNEAKKLLNEPYNPLSARECLDNLNRSNKTATQTHQTELGNLSKSLKEYGIGVRALQLLITKIDEEAAIFGNHAAAINAVDEIIDEQDKNLDIVKNNPWLSAKYQEYRKELKENCKVQGKARNAIMDLKTK